jgi:hypothetical protein
VESFETYRTHLFAIAYRMLGRMEVGKSNRLHYVRFVGVMR